MINMNMMNEIKKFEGSVTVENCLNSLLSSTSDSLGDIWEAVVECQKCPFVNECLIKIKPAFEEAGVFIDCSDVIEILLGNKTVEEVLATL